jgi:hypothetical protein
MIEEVKSMNIEARLDFKHQVGDEAVLKSPSFHIFLDLGIEIVVL